MRSPRNPLLTIIALLLPLAVSQTPALSQATTPRAPNILLILSDDHSAAHVGCYGNPDVHTPNLDRLAGSGLRFNRAYVAAPQCVPSRAAILTGRHPIDIGMTRFSAALPRDVTLFPEILKSEKGYYTGLCGRSYHLDGRLYDDPRISPHLDEQHRPNVKSRLDYVRVAQPPNLRRETIEQFGEFLDQAKDKPFFLQLCWSDPHRPLTGEDLPHRHDPAKLSLPPFYPDDPRVRKDLAAYYDEVGRMDGDVGAVLSILEKRGLADNTIVIFMGDNGASQLRGKGTLNEFGIRVPLIIRWPGVVNPNTTSDALISGEDLAPTLLSACGFANPTLYLPLTGATFLPLLQNQPLTERTQIISERGPHGTALPRSSNSFDLGRTIVTQRYKLIYNAMWQLPYQPVDFNLDHIRALHDAGRLDAKFAQLYLAPQRPMFELYDLKEDPHEMTNLAGKPQTRQIEEDLKGRLAAWMIHHRDFIPLPLSGNNKR